MMHLFTTLQRLFSVPRWAGWTLLAAALLPLGASADPITREQAQERAAAFLQDSPRGRKLSPVTLRAKLAPRRAGVAAPAAATAPYYVFDRGEQEGFIIISGDDATDAVLGYTDHGSFDYRELPPAMREWLDDMERQISEVQAGAPLMASSALPLHPAIPELMSTKWNQGDPYNLTCPNYHGLGRSVTGCVATAMAQVLYYQRAKSVTETQADMPAYEGRTNHETYGHLKVEGIPADSPIDWANMRTSYNGSESQTAKLAVANLMHYCGVSVEMDYTNGASGAYSFDVANALKNYFGYGESVRYVSRWSYTNAEWDALIYNELMNDRPVYMSGANSGGGHAFVCDGYDGRRNYHINWGWGGSSDGYYLLSKLTPGQQGIGGTNDGYNSGQDVVIGIEPEHFDDKEILFEDNNAKRLCVSAWDTDGDGRLTFGEAAAVTDLGRVFTGSRIKTFPELRNFTAVRAIPDSAFAGCTALTTLSLPEGLTSIGAKAFQGARALKNLLLPTAVSRVGDAAFADCRALAALTLPEGVSEVAPYTFQGCQALTAFDLPAAIARLGERAFAGCTRLRTFTTHTVNPQTWEVGDSLFEDVDLSLATLNVLQGTRSYFAETAPWNRFGNLYESRTQPDDQFIALTTDRVVYIYNVGTKSYVQSGEAYETQAVVGGEPVRYVLRAVPGKADTYYLVSAEPGSKGGTIFRTAADEQVGRGVKATFVDGTQQANAHWVIREVAENTYTIQVPEGQSAYKAGEFLGIDPEHRSDVFNPTMGLYYDIAYDGHEANCQWKLVDYETTYGVFMAAEELKGLLQLAKNKRVNVQREQAVMDNMDSSYEELVRAQRTLRGKLGFIHFEDEEVKSISVGNWDVDGDGELSLTEAGLADQAQGFYRKDITRFDELALFANISVLYGNSFEGCASLEHITLPAALTTMYYRVFYGCSSLTSIALPQYVEYIGDNNFDGCTALKTVSIAVENPGSIYMGSDVFKGVDLKEATLFVPKGCREAYAAAPVWKEFGTIREMRSVTKPAFSPIEADVPVYVYNLGAGKFINKGEAYGTQAVVATKGLIYQAKRQGKAENSIYYLYSDQTGNSNKVLFRTDTDSKVGAGNKTCFVDGTASAKAYWHVQPVEGRENVYTFQVPGTDASHVEGEFLGIQTDHDTEVQHPTFGLYYDVTYEGNEERCHWAFVTVTDMAAAQAVDAAVTELATLLESAARKEVEHAQEQAVYDDLESTPEQVQAAIRSLQDKLHIVRFADDRARQLCADVWDLDEDQQLSREELAVVTDIAQVFRSQTAIRSLDELRHFTSLTSIPDGAFRGSSGLVSICLPEGVKSVGENAFTSTGLKYMAVLSPEMISGGGTAAGLAKGVQVFVPAALVDAYAADDVWAKAVISEYTGIPTVTADASSRIYGRTNGKLTYAVSGAPINGEPELSCEAVATTPAGDYPIEVLPGSITTEGLQCVNGVLTVEPAPLTVTAKSYTRHVGEENPEFEVTYRTFKNREKPEVLLTQPTVECDATPESPAGTYEIRVFGAESPNYEFTYENGTLTVLDPDGIAAVRQQEKQTCIDLTGRRVGRATRRGVYVVDGKKVVK